MSRILDLVRESQAPDCLAVLYGTKLLQSPPSALEFTSSQLDGTDSDGETLAEISWRDPAVNAVRFITRTRDGRLVCEQLGLDAPIAEISEREAVAAGSGALDEWAERISFPPGLMEARIDG